MEGSKFEPLAADLVLNNQVFHVEFFAAVAADDEIGEPAPAYAVVQLVTNSGKLETQIVDIADSTYQLVAAAADQEEAKKDKAVAAIVEELLAERVHFK